GCVQVLRRPLDLTLFPYTTLFRSVVRTDKFPRNKPMHIFDLAFPRDLDVAIADYAGISLYNIEDIEARIRKNLRKRTKEIAIARSEEHTSELQSREKLVCRLLLEK